MGELQTWYEFDGQKSIENLMKTAKEIISESDADDLKEVVKGFARKSAEAMKFMVVGDAGVGKTSLLNRIFLPVFIQGYSTDKIYEVRYGGEPVNVDVTPFYCRCFVTDPALEGIALIDTPSISMFTDDSDLMNNYIDMAKGCDVVFVVFSATNITSYDVWDFIENLPSEKLVFVMTKCDQITNDQMVQAESRLRMYISEANIQAPVYCVSNVQGCMDDYLNNLITYVTNDILKGNPVLAKQTANINELNQIIESYKKSYNLMISQHNADVEVVNNINNVMDNFRGSSTVMVEQIKKNLKVVIEEEVDRYRDEIIERLDPKEIRNRFPGGYDDYVAYLDGVNENYKQMLTNKVTNKTQESIQSYVASLEKVFDEATGYIRDRESLVTFEDQFYGSLMKSRDEMIVVTNNSSTELRSYYRTLADASSDLFMNIWETRSDYENAVKNASIKGALTGAAGGMLAGTAAVGGTAALMSLSGIAATTAMTVALPVVVIGAGIAAGAASTYVLAKKFSEAKNMPQMESMCQQYLMDFRREVSEIRLDMVNDVLNNIDLIFNQELNTVDKHFSEFRINVANDAQKLPKINEKLALIDKLSDEIADIQRGNALIPTDLF